MIYLDANATVAPLPSVVDAVLDAMRSRMGNPSSVHAAGSTARAALEAARDDVCTIVPGAMPEGVFFNSGGTEGNNAVLRGFAMRSHRDTHIVTTAVEHPSVHRAAEIAGCVHIVPVNRAGIAEIEAFVRLAAEADADVIASVQWASSETGVIQPIADIIAAIRSVRPDAFIHVDAAQAVGRLSLCMEGIDALTFSGHKLHGPPGTGVLVLGDPDDQRLSPIIAGGGQESGRRSGTQNVPGAVGLGVAIRERAASLKAAMDIMRTLRDKFEDEVLRHVSGSRVNGAESPRLPNTSNILFPAIEAEALVARLDQADVACSVGTACASGKPQPSPVLKAMGLNEKDAYSSVRFSLSVLNSKAEIERAAMILADTVRGMR
jgi:cysteine desulfurase